MTRHDLRNFDAFVGMKRPIVASDLVLLVFAMNWMRSSISEFAKTITPLQELVESGFKNSDKHTKISIDDLWGEELIRVFIRLS